jgi:hypothetical protein
MWWEIFIPDHGFEPNRLCDGRSLSPIMASSQAGYVMGDLYPQSWLRAKQIMCLEILIPDHGFEPAGYVAGVQRPRWRLCAYRFYVSSTTHEALCQQVMWRVFIVSNHGFVPIGFICRPWRHTRLYAIQVIWWAFIVPNHGLVPTGFMCLPWWDTRLYDIQEIWSNRENISFWCSFSI